MVIHAYDEDYLPGAQKILGDAVDFAVMTLELEPDLFAGAFAVSSVSKQFAAGNPTYIAGMTGCELVKRVLTETQLPFRDMPDEMYVDKSPEYWAGWALAYYQWYSGRSFMEILSVVSLENIVQMYPVYHEADIVCFTDRMQEILKVANPVTKLRKYRENCGLSQSELASMSGVPVRQIQLFEQRQRDINRTAAETLLRLSRALHCSMEMLMEN